MKKLLCIIQIKNNIHDIKINGELANRPPEKRKEIIDRYRVSKKCS